MQPPEFAPRPDGENNAEATPNRPQTPPNAPLPNPQTPPLPEPFGPSRPCPRCNTLLEPNATFCPNCGERFDGKALTCGQRALVGCMGVGALLMGGIGSCFGALFIGVDGSTNLTFWIAAVISVAFAIFVMWLMARSMRRR